MSWLIYCLHKKYVVAALVAVIASFSASFFARAENLNTQVYITGPSAPSPTPVAQAFAGVESLVDRFRSTDIKLKAPRLKGVPTTVVIEGQEIAPPKPIVKAPIIAIVGLPAGEKFKRGSPMRFSYSFKMMDKMPKTFMIVRRIVNAKGKVIVTRTSTRARRPGQIIEVKVVERLHPRLSVGDYEMVIELKDARTKKTFERNAVSFTVTK